MIGVANKEVLGKTSLAGPAVNLVLSIILLLLNYYVGTPLIRLGAVLNAWIALFNLIPFSVFDGEKIFWWNKKVWAVLFATSFILTILTFRLFLFPGF